MGFRFLPPWTCVTGSIPTAFSRQCRSETEIRGYVAMSRNLEQYDKTCFTGMTDPWNCIHSQNIINTKMKEEITNCNIFLISSVRKLLMRTDHKRCMNNEE